MALRSQYGFLSIDLLVLRVPNISTNGGTDYGQNIGIAENYQDTEQGATKAQNFTIYVAEVQRQRSLHDKGEDNFLHHFSHVLSF